MQEPQSYTYSSTPHALSPDKLKKKSKYRNVPKEEGRGEDIYLDSRVASGRGSGNVPVKGSQYNVSKSMDIPPQARKKLSSGKSKPISRMATQPKDYLEELMDKPIEVDDEVDLVFSVKPTSAKFVKAKINVDAETQIEKTDFFEFDVEVEPFLEVLVGKTLHLSVIELKEEFELEVIRKEQEEFEAIRNLELIELHRLEAEYKRKNLEIDRREAQEKERLIQEEKKRDRNVARQVVNAVISEIDQRLFESLERRGNFESKIEKEVRDLTLPAVRREVLVLVPKYIVARQMAEELLLAAIRKGDIFGAQQMAEKEKRAEEKRKREAEEAERRRLEIEAAARAAAEAAEKARLEEEGAGSTAEGVEGEIE